MLSKEQLKQLRSEIVLGSVFLADYENSFDIDRDDVCVFFDSYLEDLEYMLKDNIGEENWKKLTSREETEELSKLDTIDNLYNYYCSIENPLF